MRKLKYFKIFGRKWYPALLQYQLGLHMAMILIIVACIADSCFWGLLSILSFELLPFLFAFNEKEAKRIERHGWSEINWKDMDL